MQAFRDLCSDKNHKSHLAIITNAKKLERYEDALCYIVQARATRDKYTTLSKHFQNIPHTCVPFSPYVTCAIQRFFKAKRIFDPCAGWGDRLLGFMAHDAWIELYCGVDPNAAVHAGYRAMIHACVPKSSHKKYHMVQARAEDPALMIEAPRCGFDLVFTSPPFFDWETYTTRGDAAHEQQSVVMYPTYPDWYKHFLLASIKNALNMLCVGGHIALNISNVPSYPIMDDVRRDLGQVINLKFLGTIYYGDPDVPTECAQPILVWQKICNVCMQD